MGFAGEVGWWSEVLWQRVWVVFGKWADVRCGAGDRVGLRLVGSVMARGRDGVNSVG